MNGKQDMDKLDSKDVPLTSKVARKIIEELFQKQQIWKRSTLATKVTEIHRKRGGLSGRQKPLSVVKKALSVMKKEGYLENFTFGRWRWISSLVKKVPTTKINYIDNLDSNDVPLIPSVAQKIVEELFQQQPIWGRTALADKVAEVHIQRGGLSGQQRPLSIVKKVLCNLKKENQVDNFAFGQWRWISSFSKKDSTKVPIVPCTIPISEIRSSRTRNRPTFGNPIDFRGLRHEPVNENGVVFLFGMVAHELGYLVEAVQVGFPDCEAKRQIKPGKWQQVRIEFEYESRNFHDHRHPPDGCDVIVCWHHNWHECPLSLEVIELSSVIRKLSNQKLAKY